LIKRKKFLENKNKKINRKALELIKQKNEEVDFVNII